MEHEGRPLVHSGNTAQQVVKKEWRSPRLQKLPIAATAMSGKNRSGDEGGVKSNGDAAPHPIS
jgi:hypothetical protein